MSPVISIDNPSSWITLTARIPKELGDLIEQYRETQDLPNTSAAVRELVGLALGGDMSNSLAIRSNAEAKALNMLADAFDEVISKFRESVGDLDV